MTTGDYVFAFPVVHYVFKANATVPKIWEGIVNAIVIYS
jgi:hypothetical protein